LTTKWGDKEMLKAIKNPSDKRYEITIDCPELTFLGEQEQPDFGHVNVLMVPSDKVIELKSFKKYIFSFRNSFLSYERFINTMYDHIMEVYSPLELSIEVEFRPRGGISSKLRIDSQKRHKGKLHE